MFYLTNDQQDQAVYFDLRKMEPRRRGGVVENLFHGLLGNGVDEVAVSGRSRQDLVEIAFGRGRLFDFIEERVVRNLLGSLVQELAPH